MRMFGSHSVGAGTCIQKKPERGSSDPLTNNCSSAALRKLRSYGLSEQKRSWARMRRTGPKPGISGTKSGRITVLHFFLNQMAWKGGSANLSAFPAAPPKSGQMSIFSPSPQSRLQSSIPLSNRPFAMHRREWPLAPHEHWRAQNAFRFTLALLFKLFAWKEAL